VVSSFIKSRRQGTSQRTLDFYMTYLKLASTVITANVTSRNIIEFLQSRTCTNGGRHAYYRTLRAFYNWLYSAKSGYNLNPQLNPILAVEPPKVEKKILPSLTSEQLDYLIESADCIRDKAIISLFADSGLRISELARIKVGDIKWEMRLVKVICKGNREGYAPFGSRTEYLLREWLSEFNPNRSDVWGLNKWGIGDMLKRLRIKTGLPCNPHTFRRTFASILAKRGIDSLHIMRLGRWDSLVMVERYTRSVRFEDSLKFCKGPMS